MVDQRTLISELGTYNYIAKYYKQTYFAKEVEIFYQYFHFKNL